MDTNALIKETIKYFETDENNKPKYKFEVYKSGIVNYYNKELSKLSAGLINLGEIEEDKEPVSVYTIGDVFDTISKTEESLELQIKSLPATLDNIQASLKEFGFTALNKAIGTIKAAVVPIETIQTVETVYRIVKPLVQKIVNIASIKFHFENAALVAQDVLQYLGRLAVSTAKNYLNRLMDIFLRTPIFAIYENTGDGISLAEIYGELSETANSAVYDIAKGIDSIGELMSYVNGADKVMYWPKYGELGISIQEDIVDIYHNPDSKKIYIASEHKLYQVEDNYSTTVLYEIEASIKNIYGYGNSLYYITDEDKIYKFGSDTLIKTLSGVKVVLSNPIILCNSTGFYDYKGDSIGITTSNLKYQCYDMNDDIIYYVDYTDSKYKLYQLEKADDEWASVEIADNLNPVYGMSYFNGILYVLRKMNNNKYYLSKISAGYHFDVSDYSFDLNQKRIIWTDGTYATSGNDIYSVSGTNSKTFTYKTKCNNINCVASTTYNSRNYLICSGGSHLYVSENGSNGFIWNKKLLIGENDEIALDDKNGVPDNIAGCFFFDNSYGKNFVAYSQQRFYVVGNKNISTLFNVKSSNGPGKLFRKETKSFNSWWDDTGEPVIPDKVTITSRLTIESGLIITAVNMVNNNPYVALFNVGNKDIKTGIYPAIISNGSISILYSSPVVTVNNSSIKIYSFMYKGGEWYYTDGKFLYQPRTNSKYDLPLTKDKNGNNDGALFMDSNLNILTSRQYMKKAVGKSYGDVTSLVNYETASSSVQVASTRNTLMFSDGTYVYNIVDNGEDKIDYDLFQICYEDNSANYRLIPSCDAVFIVSGNAIKKIPLYSTLTSSNYGCGYYTDTTFNKWLSAAPYYFVSNVLNSKKSKLQKDLFTLKFKENFKVELEKLLKNIPDAFVMYTKDRLIKKLDELDVSIDGDDGQILSLIKDSVASTVSTSVGMYVQQKFFEKIGDDATYESFAQSVYDACMADTENNMTKDFYDIFEEFYLSVISKVEPGSEETYIAESLIRYYQTHKAEWAKSMTDLIDIDKVEPTIYEMILNASSASFAQKSYKYDYSLNNYVFDYVASPRAEYNEDEIINAYLKNDAPAGASTPQYNFYEREYEAVGNSTISSDVQYYVKDGDEYDEIGFDDINIYYTAYQESSEASTVYYVVENNADINPDYETYYKKVGASYASVAASELTYNTYYELADKIIDERTLVRDESSNPLYYKYTDTDEVICYYNPSDEKYYKYRADSFNLSSSASVASGVTYYEKKGSVNEIYTLSSDAEPAAGKIYYSLEYSTSADTVVARGKGYYNKIGDDFEYTLASEASGADSLPLGTYYEKKEYEKAGGTSIDPDTTYYTEYFASTADLSLNTQYYRIGYEKTADTMIQPDKSYYQIIDLTGYASSPYYREYQSGDTGNRYDIVYIQYEEDDIKDYYNYFTRSGSGDASSPYVYSLADEINEQNGPYYIASFASNASGAYVVDSISSSAAKWNYVIVQNPQLNNIEEYYDQVYKPIKRPTTSGEYYIKQYVSVDEPNNIELDSYYVKASDAYVEASGLEYVYHGNGYPVGVVNDRDLYTASSSTGNYEQIDIPDPVYIASGASYVEVTDYSTISQENTYYEYFSGDYMVNNNISASPYNEGWYEKQYIPLVGGIEGSPQELGLYEASDDVYFEEVASPSGSPVQHGWYEESAIFSIPYEEKRLYIDLGGLNYASSAFIIEDNAWHNVFYTKMAEAKNSVTSSEVDVARTQAITALNGINSVIYPSWLWQSFITAAVTEHYIPAQGNQYRKIVIDSNMYPIHWDELPADISHEAFDYALTLLLYEIKQRLMTNISILVDQGKVKCYSCLDASTIIRKMVEENGSVWRNQLRKAKKDVNAATTVAEIKNAFDIIKAYNISTRMLEKYVDQQSELYAEYIDQIIEEQVINDTESEVSL